MKYAKWVRMCKREHYVFNRSFHIVIPQWKNSCANFIITLFQLIKCMIIPSREIREWNTSGGKKMFKKKNWQGFWFSLVGQSAAVLKPLEDIFKMVDIQKVLQQQWDHLWSSFVQDQVSHVFYFRLHETILWDNLSHSYVLFSFFLPPYKEWKEI